MDEQHGDVSMAPEGNAASPSIEALTASLKAMEGMMGELSRTLGSLRPSGVGYAPQATSEPLRARVEAEPLPFAPALHATVNCSCRLPAAMPVPPARPGNSSMRWAGSATISGPKRGWIRSRAR